MKKFLVFLAVLALCASAQAKTKNKSLAEQAQMALSKGKYEQAFRMAKQSCQGQNPKGCALLAYFYGGGADQKIKDEKLAKKYHIKACYGGIAGSCVQAASLELSGPESTRDKQAAIKLYKKACALKEKGACQAAQNLSDSDETSLY